MEMKARQLNNRRNKTKSYSPACLRTVQIESKTRRGNCEALRLEIPPPPALLVPRSLPPSVPRSLPPPPSSLRPFLPSVCFKLVQLGGGGGGRARAARPGGAEVRRRCSLAGSAAFIISQKSQFHFHFPTSRQREQQAAARESAARTPGRSHSSGGPGGGVLGASLGSGRKQAAVGGDSRYLPDSPS